MIKALKVLVVSALTLACLFVAMEFFLGFSGYGRYRPDVYNKKDYHRYSAPSRYRPERDEQPDPAVDENMTETQQQDETMPATADTRDS